MNKIAVVTGASSGIGYCTAKVLSQKGYRVYGLNRRDIIDNDIICLKTDVSDELSVKNSIDQIISTEGKIDILINNAGGGISGAVEFTEVSDAKNLFDLNFFGTVNVSKSVITYMRKQGSGKILNVSSVAAIAPIPFQTYYSASKSAILSYSMALANELKPFGIKVVTILPGDIKTGFTEARTKSDVGNDEYCGRISKSVSKMEHDEINGMDPQKAGEYIAGIATGKKNKPIYTVGFAYKCLSLLIKLLPTSFVNYLIGKLYAD